MFYLVISNQSENRPFSVLFLAFCVLFDNKK
nr:MAG TPA: hypothetical protein [Caudoviricetes sp.]